MDATPSPASLTHAQARKIVLGMMLPIFMGSVDQTILASALPSIGREFGNFNDLPWLITTYLIAATARRRFTARSAISTAGDSRSRSPSCAYLAGSLVCALAPNMAVLILGRVLHGIGGGGLTSTGMVVLGDVASAEGSRANTTRYFAVDLHDRRRLRARSLGGLPCRLRALVGDLLAQHSARTGGDFLHAPRDARTAAP